MAETKPKMILLTDYYPFGTAETFIENEIPYLGDTFDLTIISSETKGDMTRRVPDGVKVYRTSEKDGGHSFLRKINLVCGFLTSKMCISEALQILRGKNLKANLASSFYFYFMAKDVQKQVDSFGIDYTSKDTIIYSYWSNHKLLAFLDKRCKIKGKIITRMHGYDLYNERFPHTSRQPFKREMDKRLDKAIFVSQAGLEYYKSHFLVSDPSRLALFRLGTKAPSAMPESKSEVFTLCSCSNVIPIKRVGLIVDALKTITDTPIHWIHIGDGCDFDDVYASAKSLSQNIKYTFMGRVDNEAVIEFYQTTHIDCFVTATETEGGCPVSIQEALSFGIPVIATAVGGIPEMLVGTNNILLSSTPSANNIANAIKKIIQMNSCKKEMLKKQNLERWNKDYNEENNNISFVNFLKSL